MSLSIAVNEDATACTSQSSPASACQAPTVTLAGTVSVGVSFTVNASEMVWILESVESASGEVVRALELGFGFTGLPTPGDQHYLTHQVTHHSPSQAQLPSLSGVSRGDCEEILRGGSDLLLQVDQGVISGPASGGDMTPPHFFSILGQELVSPWHWLYGVAWRWRQLLRGRQMRRRLDRRAAYIRYDYIYTHTHSTSHRITLDDQSINPGVAWAPPEPLPAAYTALLRPGRSAFTGGATKQAGYGAWSSQIGLPFQSFAEYNR